MSGNAAFVQRQRLSKTDKERCTGGNIRSGGCKDLAMKGCGRNCELLCSAVMRELAHTNLTICAQKMSTTTWQASQATAE